VRVDRRSENLRPVSATVIRAALYPGVLQQTGIVFDGVAFAARGALVTIGVAIGLAIGTTCRDVCQFAGSDAVRGPTGGTRTHAEAEHRKNETTHDGYERAPQKGGPMS
jgi:hypothetical protein